MPLAGEVKYTDEELAEFIVNFQRDNPSVIEAHICAKLGVADNYLRRRSKDSELVCTAIKKARQIRSSFYWDLGIKNIENNKFQGTPWIFMMKNLGFKPDAVQEDDDESYIEP